LKKVCFTDWTSRPKNEVSSGGLLGTGAGVAE